MKKTTTSNGLLKCNHSIACAKLLSFLILFFAINSSNASNYYWVGGTGNWSDFANHWATTSGGVIFNTTIPSPNDDVFFDSNSFLATGDTVLADSTIINCHNMDWSGVTNHPVFRIMQGGILKLYGSLTFGVDMKCYSANIEFDASTLGNTITSAGQMVSILTFNNNSGSWTLLDSLKAINVSVMHGTLNTNNNYVNCYDFTAGYYFAGGATVLLGT